MNFIFVVLFFLVSFMFVIILFGIFVEMYNYMMIYWWIGLGYFFVIFGVVYVYMLVFYWFCVISLYEVYVLCQVNKIFYFLIKCFFLYCNVLDKICY